MSSRVLLRSKLTFVVALYSVTFMASAGLVPDSEQLLNDYGLTDSGEGSVEDWGVEVAADNAGNIVALWITHPSVNQSPYTYFVRVSRSSDGGATWSIPAQLNVVDPEEGMRNAFHPHITTDGNGTWLASWASEALPYSSTSQSEIVVSRSTNNGVTWFTPTTIQIPESIALRTHDYPCIAGDGSSNWVIVWDAIQYGILDKDVFASHSSDDGVTWSPAIFVNSGGATDEAKDIQPSIATDSAGNWLTVWQGDNKNTLLSRSTDNGASWSTKTVVYSNTTPFAEDIHPMIVTDGTGNWLTCWSMASGGSGQVVVSRSTDIGLSWSSLTYPAAGYSTNYGRLATDGAGHWLLMAREPTQSGSGIVLSRSVDAGMDWDKVITPTTGANSTEVSVALGTDGTAIALRSDTTELGTEVFIRRSSDYGLTWGEQERLDETAVLNLPATDTAPLLATDGAGVWVSAWISSHGTTAAPVADVVIIRSDDDGLSWSPPTFIAVPGLDFKTRTVRTDLVTDGAGVWLLPVPAGPVVLRSVDNGVTWSEPIPLPGKFSFASTPPPYGSMALAANGDGVWIIAGETYQSSNPFGFAETDIHITRSDDDGLTWSTPQLAAPEMTNDGGWAPDNVPPVMDMDPSIVADGLGQWIVSWTQSKPVHMEIPRSISSDNGLTWTPIAVTTSAGAHRSEKPVIRTDGAGNWVACWLGYSVSGSNRTAPYRVYSARSTDGGATWFGSQTLHSDDVYPMQDLDLAMATDVRCAATWSSAAHDGDLDVFAAYSGDAGTTWSAPFAVNDTAAGEAGASDIRARIASASFDRWMLVWHSDHDLVNGGVDDADIHYTRLVDGGLIEGALEGNEEGSTEGVIEGIQEGATEGIPEGEAQEVGIIEGELNMAEEADLSGHNGVNWLPRIATNSAGHWVAVMESSASITGGSDPDIFAIRSSNHGATWSEPVMVNSDGVEDNDHDRFPVIATDSAGVWIAAWVHKNKIAANTYDDGYIRFSRSTDNGTTWSTPASLEGVVSASSLSVDLAYSGDGHWVVVWQTTQPIASLDDYNVIGAHSDDNGVTWSAPVQIVPNRPFQYSEERSPVVACDGDGNCVVAFEFEPKFPPEPEPTGYNRVIKFVRSVDHGHTWSYAGVLDNNGYSGVVYDVTPTLAAGSDGLWLACWYESGEMMLARSTDEGATWRSPASINHGVIAALGVDGRAPRLSSHSGSDFALVYSQYRAMDVTAYNVAASYSTDGGLHWKQPTVINASVNSTVANLTDSWPDVVLADDNVAVAIWTGNLDLANDLPTNYKIHSTSFELIPWNLEGEQEGNDEGDGEGNVEGLTEGVAEGQAEGVDEGTEEGSPEGDGEGSSEGVDEEGEGITEGGDEGEGEPAPMHAIDLDGNGELSLSELLRGMQLYNAGGFACASESESREDRFTPGDGGHACEPHSGDYNPQDWIISISELLRMIQFFNLGGLYSCPDAETEDGYCPGSTG